MFSLITATIGPLANVEVPLSPTGTTTVRARSKSGKSHLPVCLLFALYGCDEYGDALDHTWTPPDAERVDVRVTTGKGAVWGRTLRATVAEDGKVSRSYTRFVQPVGEEPQRPASDAAMAALLPKQITADPELVRCILAPMVWRDLAESEGNGRKLTALLERVLGKGDVRAEVAALMKAAGHELRAADPLDEKGAGEQRRKANLAAAGAKGAADEARRNLAALPQDAAAEAPGEDEQEAAGETLAAYTAWDDFDHAQEVHDRLVKARAEAEERLATWRKGVADLGARPVVDAEATRAASARLLAARDAAKEARAAHSKRAEELLAASRAIDAAEALQTDAAITTAEAALLNARANLAAAETKAGPLASVPCQGRRALVFGSEADEEVGAGTRTDCSTCRYLTDAQAAAATLDALRADVATAETAVTDARRGFPGRKAKAIDAATDAHKAAQAAASRASEATKKAEAEEQAAADAQNEATNAGAKAATWQTARTALGDEPKVPVAPAEVYVPDVERPTAEAVTEAKRVLKARDDAETVAKERAQRRAEAAAAVTTAESAVGFATREATRCEALVDAVRKAPGEIAERQKGALGELGPCSVHFLPGGGCEVRVRGDDGVSRAWNRVKSGGEQVLADLWFRVGLARAAKMEWLTIFVDEAQLLTGAKFPEFLTATGKPRPLVIMEGADCDLVSSAAPTAAREVA